MAADAQELLCSALHCSRHCTFTIFNNIFNNIFDNIFNIKLTRSLGAPPGPDFKVAALRAGFGPFAGLLDFVLHALRVQ